MAAAAAAAVRWTMTTMMMIVPTRTMIFVISIVVIIQSTLIEYGQSYDIVTTSSSTRLSHDQWKSLTTLSFRRRSDAAYYSAHKSSSSSSLHSVNGDFVDDDVSSSTVAAATVTTDQDVNIQQQKEERERLKVNMLQLGASYDRGFGASSRAVDEARTVISKLETINPCRDASRGIDGNDQRSSVSSSDTDSSSSPLKGNWRMVWTTASDVLVLGANPFISVGAIYQIFDPPVVTNVIDLLPRFQIRADSVLRAEVTTRASSRRNKPLRIGLIFESVKLRPVELLGNKGIADILPPFAFDLPRVTSPEILQAASSIAAMFSPTTPSSSTDTDNDIGYFDVTYLDDDLLIIRQNAPGGLFVLTKVENSDP